MSQTRVSLEIKVGAFIVTSAAALLVVLFAIGDLGNILQPTYTLRVRFDTANGISQGAPVQYAGVEVGKVEAVHMVRADQPAPKVEMMVRLPQQVKVRATDTAAISTFGLLGEKYLELTPSNEPGPVLRPGELLMGKPPVSTEQIIERSNEVLTELQLTLEGINSLVADPEARIYLEELLQEARDATRNWRVLGERLNLTLTHVEQGHGSLGKLLYTDQLHQEMEAFVEDLKQHPWKLLARPKDKK